MSAWPDAHPSQQDINAPSQGIHASEQSVHARELCIHAPELCVHARELCIHTREQRVHARELCVHAPELGVHARETRVHAPELRIHAREQSIHARELLPPEIGRLTALTSLNLMSNQLSALPLEIGQLTTLNALYLHDNPLADELLERASAGTKELLAYLRELARDKRPHYEVKLVFVGPGGVGKTCLLRCLQGKEPSKKQKTTYGIEIAREPLRLEHPDGPETTIHLNCWDFGGQETYEITHQFFFSPRSIYLVLWTPRDGLERCNVEGWIDLIRQRVGSSARVIVVATHVLSDDHPADVDQSDLRHKFGDVIVDFVKIDSFKPDAASPGKRYGIAKLRALIKEVAAGMPEPFPARYRAAREDVLRLARGDGSAGGGRAWMYYEEFARLAARHELDAEATRTLARLIDVQGHVVYHDAPPDQKVDPRNVVVLHPEWLGKAIGRVLEDEQTRRTAGQLAHERLPSIWAREDIPEKLAPYFLRLMETFDVSYRLDQTTSLVPQLVPAARPKLPWEPADALRAGQRQLTLIFNFYDVPRGVMPITTVQTHRYHKDSKLHWQRGTFLEHSRHGSALIELRGRELVVTSRGAYPLHFLDVLADQIEMMIDDIWPGVRRDAADGYQVMVPCYEMVDDKPCPGREELETLRLDQIDSVTHRRCNRCRQRLDISRLLLGFESQDAQVIERLDSLREQLDSFDDRLEQRLDQLIFDTWRQRELSDENVGRLSHLYRTIVQGLTSVRRDGPCLFSLVPEGRSLTTNRHRLTLWCEHVDGPHPCSPIGSGGLGDYVVSRPRAWLKRWAPAISWMVKILKIATPIAGAMGSATADALGLDEMKANIDIMEAVAKALPGGELEVGKLDVPRAGLPAQLGDGELRMFHDFLAAALPERSWGNLKRAYYKGDFLWLCPTHYEEYEPGLPGGIGK